MKYTRQALKAFWNKPGCDYMHNLYGTALYTCVQGHACASMFNACKTLKTGMCTHCCMQFWRAQGQ